MSGAGKSTLSRRLGNILGLPVVHLDQLSWQAGWQEVPRNEFLRRINAALSEEAWIIDGNYGATLDHRLARAQAVVWLDYDRWTCMGRVLGRITTGYGRVRPDMAPGCPEQLSLEFLHWVWTHHDLQRRHNAQRLRRLGHRPALYCFSDPDETERWVQSLQWAASLTGAGRG